MQEQKYFRCQREPLGKSIMRNYKFPELVKDNNFRFGVETTGGKFYQKILLLIIIHVCKIISTNYLKQTQIKN